MDILGAVQGGMSVLGGLFNAGSQIWANQQNMELQKQEWQREDSAVQRRVADLKAAGLNPVLAAEGGGSPSSLAVRVGAPQFDAPDLSKVYSAAIGRNAVAAGEANIRAANAQAGIAETNAEILRKQYSLGSDLVPSGISPLVWFPIQRQIAENQKAVADARAAESEANILERNDRINEKWQEGLTIANLVGSGLGGVSNALRAGAILAPK